MPISYHHQLHHLNYHHYHQLTFQLSIFSYSIRLQSLTEGYLHDHQKTTNPSSHPSTKPPNRRATPNQDQRLKYQPSRTRSPSSYLLIMGSPLDSKGRFEALLIISKTEDMIPLATE